ncbi:MAG: ABC transporter permease [Planctomycetes bacterium]|nr:ABC transporter permease [Planctomycetota bacterium]
MSALWSIAGKDLLLLWRDRAALFWLLGLPLLFATFFGAVFPGGGGGGRAMSVVLVDDAANDGSRAFVRRLETSAALRLAAGTLQQARAAVRDGDATAYLHVVRMPDDGLGMFGGTRPELELGLDPSRRAEAGVLQGLVMEALFGGFREVFADRDRGREAAAVALESVRAADELPAVQRLVLTTFLESLDRFLAGVEMPAGDAAGPFEPRLAIVDVARTTNRPFTPFEISFPQAIVWGLMGTAAGLALTLVRERREGTMVRLLAAPVGRATLLGGKLAASFVASCAVVAVLVAVGALVFGVRVPAPLALLAAALCSALAFAGLMLLLSTLGDTEQAVAGGSWGVLLVCAMLGGGMVPQFVMPDWMLAAGAVSPVRWAIAALEGATWRGVGAGRLLTSCAVLVGMGAATAAVGCARLRRRV